MILSFYHFTRLSSINKSFNDATTQVHYSCLHILIQIRQVGWRKENKNTTAIQEVLLQLLASTEGGMQVWQPTKVPAN